MGIEEVNKGTPHCSFTDRALLITNQAARVRSHSRAPPPRNVLVHMPLIGGPDLPVGLGRDGSLTSLIRNFSRR